MKVNQTWYPQYYQAPLPPTDKASTAKDDKGYKPDVPDPSVDLMKTVRDMCR